MLPKSLPRRLEIVRPMFVLVVVCENEREGRREKGVTWPARECMGQGGARHAADAGWRQAGASMIAPWYTERRYLGTLVPRHTVHPPDDRLPGRAYCGWPWPPDYDYGA